MRLLVLGMGDPAEQPGGLNRYVFALAGALGVEPVTVPPRAPLPVRLVTVARLARGADVVDAHLALYAWWPVVVGRLRRTPLVVHLHGPWADEDPGAGPVVRAAMRAVERAVYRRASRVVVLSPSVRDVAVGRYGVDPARVVVVPPGVDRERFRPGPDERAALGVPADRPLLLTVRRLVPRTGVDVLLAALRDVPDAHLAVVGDGPERPRLAALADPARTTFAGRVDDAELARWYRSAAVTVVPSVAHEGWGLVVEESLASGTPVVASRQGGLVHALASFPDCLVPPGDPAALAARLRAALAGDVPSAQECRAATRDWSRTAARTRELCAAVARPRVVVVGHTAVPSGAELALTVLAPELARCVELTVVLGEHGPVADRLRAAGIAVDVLPLPPGLAGRPRTGLRPADAAAALHAVRLARLLRRRRATLVHAWTLTAGLVAVPAARLAGVPVVWSARDRLTRDHLPDTVARGARLLARSTHVVANSRTTLGTWRTGGTVVGSPGVVRGPVARAEGPFTLACLSRLAPWKGQDLALRAFARAFPDGDARLRLVGGTWFGAEPVREQLRQLAGELGVADRVDVVGHRDDVAAELAHVDVVVACSTVPEPFGQVVVDALVAGRAVVATAEGGPAETLTDGVDGLLVPPRDEGALAAALRRLSEDPALRARLAHAGRSTAERYRPDRLAAALVEVYREVLP